eukprot:m.71684 g.71684  ORF g.71684 m.71684 type:complete len:591 (-) comp7961_c0_seq3:474-2246(-)
MHKTGKPRMRWGGQSISQEVQGEWAEECKQTGSVDDVRRYVNRNQPELLLALAILNSQRCFAFGWLATLAVGEQYFSVATRVANCAALVNSAVRAVLGMTLAFVIVSVTLKWTRLALSAASTKASHNKAMRALLDAAPLVQRALILAASTHGVGALLHEIALVTMIDTCAERALARLPVRELKGAAWDLELSGTARAALAARGVWLDNVIAVQGGAGDVCPLLTKCNTIQTIDCALHESRVSAASHGYTASCALSHWTAHSFGRACWHDLHWGFAVRALDGWAARHKLLNNCRQTINALKTGLDVALAIGHTTALGPAVSTLTADTCLNRAALIVSSRCHENLIAGTLWGGWAFFDRSIVKKRPLVAACQVQFDETRAAQQTALLAPIRSPITTRDCAADGMCAVAKGLVSAVGTIARARYQRSVGGLQRVCTEAGNGLAITCRAPVGSSHACSAHRALAEALPEAWAADAGLGSGLVESAAFVLFVAGRGTCVFTNGASIARGENRQARWGSLALLASLAIRALVITALAPRGALAAGSSPGTARRLELGRAERDLVGLEEAIVTDGVLQDCGTRFTRLFHAGHPLATA